MSYFFKVFLLILCLQGISAQAEPADTRSHSILVSIAPYEYIVKRIVGDTEKVILFVPSGASPHYFEPNAKQVLIAAKSDIWFLMGEAFEKNALNPIQGYNSHLKAVDLREGIDLLYDSCSCCAHHGDPDPHIWMSPRNVKKQAQKITHTLISVYPEHQHLFEKNLHELTNELDTLDYEISILLEPYKGRSIMVSHPAYAYFCRDYQLVQLPIEFEGKDPSPKQLTKILEQSRSAKISTIFIQMQHSSKGAYLIANQINAKIETIDPLSENYLENMRIISKKFFNSFN
jgi:zinc transport system substrate-binding protein